MNNNNNINYLINLKSWKQKYICSKIKWDVNIINNNNKKIENFVYHFLRFHYYLNVPITNQTFPLLTALIFVYFIFLLLIDTFIISTR